MKYEQVNLTHALLDCYDEAMELDDYSQKQVIVISPDKEKQTKQDLREIFDVDRFHYKDHQTPLIIRMTHARLWPACSQLFDMCFNVLIALLVLSSKHGIDNP